GRRIEMTTSIAPSASPSALLGNYKRAPSEFVDGDGVYLVDADGKRYLDFVSGIAVNALGYDDAGLKAAMHAAADGLVHTSNLYSTSPGERLAAALVARSFADKVFFCNSGAEANEGAFKFARRWARTRGEAKHEIVALRGAFHGRLFATLAATKERDVALIFDEIQCGLGRTGTLFAYEQFDVVPDMVTLAKPLAGGLPMGAILMTNAIAETIKPGDHGTTFGGGPFLASVANHVFGRLSDPALLRHV